MTRNEATDVAMRVWGTADGLAPSNEDDVEWWHLHTGPTERRIIHGFDANGHPVCHDKCRDIEAAPILQLRDGYERPRKRLPNKLYRFRPMVLAEIKELRSGQRVWFRDVKGTARQLTINGAVQNWRTDSSRVEVPVKYGMYEYARLDTREALDRLLVRLE